MPKKPLQSESHWLESDSEGIRTLLWIINVYNKWIKKEFNNVNKNLEIAENW